MDANRKVLAEAADHLRRVGEANDAADRGCDEAASRTRDDACAALRGLLGRHPSLGDALPTLRGDLESGAVLGFGWSRLLDELEPHLAGPS